MDSENLIYCGSCCLASLLFDYDNGIALVLGKTLPGCPYPYCFALDFDGEYAVMEFFGSWENVLSLSKKRLE
jgi:hypothetical protein